RRRTGVLRQADEAAAKTFRVLPPKRVASDEVALVDLHDPAEPGLERRRLLVDVVGVEHEPLLEAGRVAGAEARREKVVRGPGGEDPTPHALGVAGSEIDLEAVFAGVAGARHDRARTRDLALGDAEARKLRELDRGQLPEHGLRARALQREQREV